jgi:hypothetical protein
VSLYFLKHCAYLILCALRYRRMPTYGRDTIRRFVNNICDMKSLAGRDFEGMLKCAMPVFEGIFPAMYEKIVLDLLFDMAAFHGHAKIRMHISSTLDALDYWAGMLGISLKRFADMFKDIETHELPVEQDRRERRARARAEKEGRPPPPSKRAVKKFPLDAYKMHQPGHYALVIRNRSTADNLSSQRVGAVFVSQVRLKLMRYTGRAGAWTSQDHLSADQQDSCSSRYRYWRS